MGGPRMRVHVRALATGRRPIMGHVWETEDVHNNSIQGATDSLWQPRPCLNAAALCDMAARSCTGSAPFAALGHHAGDYRPARNSIRGGPYRPRAGRAELALPGLPAPRMPSTTTLAAVRVRAPW